MKRAALIILIFLGAAFAFGLARLYTLRFETGDVYPAYSSLRADPMGARALFESLERLLPAERNYRPLARLDAPHDATIFWLGAEAEELELPRADLERLEAFIGGGGRLVIALKPLPTAPRFQSFGTPPPAVKKQSADGDDETASPIAALTNRWNFSIAYLSLPRDERRVYRATTAQRVEDLPLPESLPVHTAVGFSGVSNAWRVIYARTNNHAIVIERRFGRGSIVLSADAVPLSNEALLKDRHSDLLAWFTGPARRVIFDEAHLGVTEDPGVATLARRYRLHGLFAALLGLAGLYVWKNSSRLVPPLESASADDSEAVMGRDSAAGFVNLLRRSLPRDRLLATCLEQWNADCLRTARPSQGRLEQMQAIVDEQNALPPKQRDPVATYRRFVRVLQHASRSSRREEAPNNRAGEDQSLLTSAATPQVRDAPTFASPKSQADSSAQNSRLPSSRPTHEH